jgi:LPLT family lysophospholipid transporter-like MFS transporter
VLILIGAIAGFFVVPMNALLQHRGHVLMSAGHSIAVQNFNENVSILVMLALYSLMIRYDMRIQSVVLIFGLFISGMMYLIMRWNNANHRADPDLDRHIRRGIKGRHSRHCNHPTKFTPGFFRGSPCDLLISV